MEWARELFGMCQSQHWGVRLGLHLALSKHVSTRLTRRIGQLSCMDYDSETNSYSKRVLLYNPNLASDYLVVPRILPAAEKFQDELAELSKVHGFEMTENGRISSQSLRSQLGDMLVETASLLGVPLNSFTEESPLSACIQLDAARRRSRQFLPVVLKNPALDSQSFFALRVLALGVGMKDDRAETQQLLRPNLEAIEEMLQLRSILLRPADAGAAAVRVAVRLKFTGDFAGVLAIEGSLCGCAAIVIHSVPTRNMLATVAALRQTCASSCDNCTLWRVRWARTHTPLPGKDLPERCDMCQFASNPTTAAAELDTFTGRLAELESNASTAAGKTALSNFVRALHKLKHANTGPGPNATPLTSARHIDWILDLLLFDLNLGKLTWKWALTRRLPAETRQRLSSMLSSYGYGLGLRTKEEGRQSQDKFYHGGDWQRVISGGKKAPPSQIIIAK
eukprot:6176039-Pleurochrysis_carterae.AAC.1